MLRHTVWYRWDHRVRAVDVMATCREDAIQRTAADLGTKEFVVTRVVEHPPERSEGYDEGSDRTAQGLHP